MKLNNKGFAITSIIYSMLILFLTLVVLIISNLASRKVVFDKQKEEIMNKFEESTLLPAEYQQVEYIESSGTQRILTNIIPNDKTGLKIEWLFYENLDQVVVLGTKQFWFGHQGDTLVFGWNGPIFNDVMPVETKLDVRLNYMNDRKMQYSYKDSSEVHSSSQPITKTLNNQTQSVEIFFGDVHIKLYSLVITQESQTIANFIPCYRKSDNVIGLYDLVDNEFYTNSGTGNFQMGPKV